ncbi:hypothetical protein [Dongia sp.]|uniref:hypothetical protein n=1 Tax=Dongia sp. TaxID=1977262 RepID=UPI0035B40B3E
MKLSSIVLLMALSVGFGSAAARADSAAEPGATAPILSESAGNVGDIIIDEIERRIIRSYYQRQYDQWNHGAGKGQGKAKKKAKGMPPGLAKRGELPPGLSRQLVRNGHLPPGLEGRDLPPELLRQLPPLHAGYRYVVADDKVMLVQSATNVILDALTVAAIDLVD